MDKSITQNSVPWQWSTLQLGSYVLAMLDTFFVANHCHVKEIISS